MTEEIVQPQIKHGFLIDKGPLREYSDIFESANFYFRMGLPSTRIRRIRL